MNRIERADHQHPAEGFMERPSAWKSYLNSLKSFSITSTKAMLCSFPDNKTGECSATAIRLLKKLVTPVFLMPRSRQKLKTGDKVYADIRGKSVIFVQLGKQPLQNGLNIPWRL